LAETGELAVADTGKRALKAEVFSGCDVSKRTDCWLYGREGLVKRWLTERLELNIIEIWIWSGYASELASVLIALRVQLGLRLGLRQGLGDLGLNGVDDEIFLLWIKSIWLYVVDGWILRWIFY
jgi:hypothetical protein